MKKIIYYTPRVLGWLYIFAISLFVVDVFDLGLEGFDIVIGIFIHLLPSIIFATALLLAKKRPKLAGSVFIFMGLLYLAIVQGMVIQTYLIMTGVPVAVGIMLLWAAKKRQFPAKHNNH